MLVIELWCLKIWFYFSLLILMFCWRVFIILVVVVRIFFIDFVLFIEMWMFLGVNICVMILCVLRILVVVMVVLLVIS